ncbi:lactate utilization protein C [Paenibacillus sp. JSM ZJ436]|uniref:lactate utilization protein C n=1 Tax=Paenibacillus sp. JSM ZJ436 TaxID=3376190 RepID=UPI00379D804D
MNADQSGAGSPNSREAWLAELQAASLLKQKSFMEGIAAKLNRPRILSKPEQPFRGAPEFWNSFQWTTEEQLQQFIANFQAAGGQAVHLATSSEAANFIAGLAEEMKATRILMHHQPGLDRLRLAQQLQHAQVTVWNDEVDINGIEHAARAEIGVIEADHAVAYTGSLVTKSSAHQGRSVSLLPAVLIAIIPVSRLVTRLGEVLAELDSAGREKLPAGIHFISGPSRSADIENDLTIGVHGPGIVYALLVDQW